MIILAQALPPALSPDPVSPFLFLIAGVLLYLAIGGAIVERRHRRR